MRKPKPKQSETDAFIADWVYWDVADARVNGLIELCKRVEEERNAAQEAFRQANRDFGCEGRDPYGTIWDYAAKLQEENKALKDEREGIVKAATRRRSEREGIGQGEGRG